MDSEISPPQNILGKLRKKILGIGIFLIICFMIFFGYKYLTDWRFFISTDDAYVSGDITAIASKVPGYIASVNVKANQFVNQGDILFKIDDGDYKIALSQAEAQLQTQTQTLARIKQQIVGALNKLDAAHAEESAALAIKKNAELTLNRANALQKSHTVAQSNVDNAQSQLDQAGANVKKAQAQIKLAQSDVDTLQAQYKEQQSQTLSLKLARDKAQRDLDFTILRAPISGVIGNLAGRKGDYISNGQRLAALVPIDLLYIDANYKETQLPFIYSGETVTITLDGYDQGSFKGKVLSLAPASGAVFSILPPQNATGNFTKIVQRIAVRISIPSEILATGRVRAGMSAYVSIDTRTKPKNGESLSSQLGR